MLYHHSLAKLIQIPVRNGFEVDQSHSEVNILSKLIYQSIHIWIFGDEIARFLKNGPFDQIRWNFKVKTSDQFLRSNEVSLRSLFIKWPNRDPVTKSFLIQFYQNQPIIDDFRQTRWFYCPLWNWYRVDLKV